MKMKARVLRNKDKIRILFELGDLSLIHEAVWEEDEELRIAVRDDAIDAYCFFLTIVSKPLLKMQYVYLLTETAKRIEAGETDFELEI